MLVHFWSKAAKRWSGHSRREFFRRGALATAALSLGGRIRQVLAAPLEYGANLYRSIGVKPLINAKGTFTIITGSQTLAGSQAGHGRRLARLRSDG